MVKFNKINFGLLMLLFLCRFENILGVSDKNIEEGLKEKYKIVDLKGSTLKNEKGEDFSFIVTCKYNRNYYKYSEEIESDFKEIEEEKRILKQLCMKNELKNKSGVFFDGDMLKTQDKRVLVVKDSEKENKGHLVLRMSDKKNSKTTNIFLDKSYNLQTYGFYDIIKEDNTAYVVINASKDCGGVEINKGSARKFQIVCCKLVEVKPEVSLEELDDFVVDSGCCDRLCIWCKNLCH